MSEGIAPLIASRAQDVASRTVSALTKSTPKRGTTVFPREKQDLYALRNALGLALDELYSTNADRDVVLAIDESFLVHPRTIELLWKRLLFPSSRNEQFDYDRLVAALLVSWQPTSGAQTDGWAACRAVIEVLVDILCDKVVRNLPKFRDTLASVLPDPLDGFHPIPARMMLSLLTTEGASGPVTSRLDLFRKFVPEWPGDAATDDWLTQTDDLRALRKLAFETLRRNHVGRFPVTVATSALGHVRFGKLMDHKFAQQFLDCQDEVTFQPASVQTYLAAGALCELCVATGVSRIESFLFHPNWEEPVALLAGMLRRDLLDRLFNALLRPRAGSRFLLYHDHLRLAAACLHETAFSGLSAEGILNDEVDRLLQMGDYAAFDILANWGKGSALQRIVDILCNGTLPASGKMLTALKKARPGLVVTAVVGGARSECFHVELAARDLDSVLEDGMFDRHPPLPSPPSDASGYVEPSVLQVGVRNERGELAAATVTLPKVKHECIFGWELEYDGVAKECQRLEFEDSVAVLEMALTNKDSEPSIRYQAARRLGAVGSDEPDLAMRALLQALNDMHNGVRGAAAESLARVALRSGRTERIKVVEQLVALLGGKARADSREDIIRALRAVDRALRADVELE